MKKIGVSQKSVIFNKQEKFLTIRRTSTALSNPNKWDLPGGDLDFGEGPINGMIREIKEETGLEVGDLKPFDVHSYINKIDDFWVTIAYKTKSNSNKVVLSYEHDDFKWVTPEEFLKLESPDKIRRFIKKLK